MNDVIEQALKELDEHFEYRNWPNEKQHLQDFLRSKLEEAYKRGREDQKHIDIVQESRELLKKNYEITWKELMKRSKHK